ncbi:Protein lifeguard 3 [Armadillidium nasatum]|uniref:Protein lifeguard 3 n=1 Tax=Armadillidium nasatum TaxID=96803 RepID=A0A5N5TFZ8_9CRUS|nr:Protein lifeguard 3 [Armadillidium nasatum]
MKQPEPIIIVNAAKSDPEAVYSPTESSYINLFDDKKIRHDFISKLIVTLGIMCLFIFVEEVNTYVRNNTTIFWVAFGLTFFCLIALICFGNLRRKFPLNYIFLGIFTICEGILLGTVSAFYDI